MIDTNVLVVPLLLFNAVFARRLPKAYEADVFGDQIPLWIRIGENITRTIVFALPFFMALNVRTLSQKTGFALYVIGAILYCLSWGVQIRYPQSPWCQSGWGFMAPAYTPLLWLVGIGLIGDTILLQVSYSRWTYIGLSVAFLTFHNVHAWIVYKRTY